MAYPYEALLTEKAQELINRLTKAGITAAIVPGSVREFSLKISVTKDQRSCGNAVLYYSPKKAQFSLKYNEMKDQSLEPELENVWNNDTTPTDTPVSTAAGVEIYVDGSFVNGAIGFGVVILQNGRVTQELSGQVNTDDDPSLLESHQVAGEIHGVRAGLNWCQENDITAVTINYDYTGLEQWATGGWRAKQPLTQDYAAFIRTCGVDITWRKVAAHTGQRWNEQADTLARQAASARLAVEPAADPVTEVKQVAQEFITFLETKGIMARCDDRVYNNQYVRLYFLRDHKEMGQCDIYNTAKHRLDPHWQKFAAAADQAAVEVLWREFRTGKLPEDGPVVSPATPPRSEIEYYYTILKPYAGCAFDFIDLAQALARAAAKQPGSDVSLGVETARYDFQKLEVIYNSLRS